ncbi:fasciclin domain-containing protein [Luteolibacter pohnpeiensis]|uniref:Fasciclin domain-containing protein n=1 Tax=Luteolibacter pohnpeiensis TaxID=454153 RepID=A0A934VPP5_9BACT|nr:fasciclin domain-containing protein [Luteolibacter pohnpeiensis]MBK1881241.1 fasciclin domain-containing protein [Luteolibacter pohnpeiensis]
MKTSIPNHRSICLSAATLALIFSLGANAETVSPPVVGTPPAEWHKSTPASNEKETPAIPESGVNKAQAIDIKPVDKDVEKIMEKSEKPAPELTITEIVKGSEDFTTFVAAIKAAGMQDTLKGDGPFTVFAPTNEAFDALPEGVLETLMNPENKEMLKSLLSYHLLNQKLTAEDIVPGDYKTAEGENLIFAATDDGSITLQGAKVIRTDIMATNGVIHVVDKVLVPPTMTIEPAKENPASTTAAKTAER